MNAAEAKAKFERLHSRLAALPSLAVAFSGGADSTFLLASAIRAVPGKVVAFTISSPAHAARELEHAQMTVQVLKADWRVIPSGVTDIDPFRANGPDRCYHCKLFILQELITAARKEGVDAVAEGTTADELLTPRPGTRAVRELGVLSPLADAGLTKKEVRHLARLHGVPNFDRPANPCLATRIPTGEPITAEKLGRVARAEEVLSDAGFRQIRCRLFADGVRIELGEKEIERAASPEVRRVLMERLREIGFCYVVLDLGGYRAGGAGVAAVP